MSLNSRSLLAAGTIVVGTLFTACADATVAPLAPDFAAPSMVLTSTVNVNQYLEREKNRIKLAQEQSKPAYDSLKKEWERLKKRYPNGNPELLYCDPLQYSADTKIIGPEGGDMSIGPHKLSIPRGALLRPTVITGEMPVSLTVGVQLSQHGLVFQKDVKLTLSYKHCNRPNTFAEQVVYVDNNNRILERPKSVDKGSDGLVEAIIRHFSGYMVSSGRHAASEDAF
ncbi:MAG: hypothetical protein H7Z40_02745 [Phycisphaerae bacterium]|nr:hypothetical protein [Gemmatimonadaceae bacterium]